VDPSADEEDQEAESPYGYVANNPISRNDPDGRIWGNIIGAVVGAAVDYGTQVATNYVKGEKNPWTNNINMVSIGTAALEGALTSGASAVKNLGAKIAIKGAATLINNTVEAKTSKQGLQVKVERDVANVLKNSAIDGAVGMSLKVLPGAKTVQKVASKGGLNAGNVAKETKKFSRQQE